MKVMLSKNARSNTIRRSVKFTGMVIFAMPPAPALFQCYCKTKYHSSRRTNGMSSFFSSLHGPTNTVILITVLYRRSVLIISIELSTFQL